jgi:hypothetical protein
MEIKIKAIYGAIETTYQVVTDNGYVSREMSAKEAKELAYKLTQPTPDYIA